MDIGYYIRSRKLGRDKDQLLHDSLTVLLPSLVLQAMQQLLGCSLKLE
jgi:hypothetical protein